MMDTSAQDSILGIQLAVGRLVEKELCGWWNVDLVHRLGGADFLQRLTDARMAQLSAGEGLLLAAGKAEKLASMPQGIATLFRPAVGVIADFIARAATTAGLQPVQVPDKKSRPVWILAELAVSVYLYT